MITSSATFGADLVDIDAPAPDPLALLISWLPPNTNELRPLMTLSTIDANGYPDARNVLVSLVDADGLHFHTDSRSRKAAQLASIPRAAAALVWPEIGRQLVVQGDVLRASPPAAAQVFGARSRYLQLLAWANTNETAQLSQAARRTQWAEFDRQHPDGSLRPPPTWVGFVLRPARLTFWRGDPQGPSQRTEYRQSGSGWQVTRLPG